MPHKKWGLALGGGGIFGFAHIGVLGGLESHGLYANMLTGTSAGALVAGLYAAGINLTEIEANTLALLEPANRARILGLDDDILFIRGNTVSASGVHGIIGGKLFETYLQDITKGKHLSQVTTPLSIIAVDIETGEEVVFTNEPPHPKSKIQQKKYVTDATLAEAIRASVSLPGIFIPKHFQEKLLVDGGIKNMVPVDELKRADLEEIVAVDLGLRLEQPENVRNLWSIVARSFALACRPETRRSINLYATVTLQPKVYDIGIPTPTKIRTLIQAGRECVEQNANRLKSILL